MNNQINKEEAIILISSTSNVISETEGTFDVPTSYIPFAVAGGILTIYGITHYSKTLIGEMTKLVKTVMKNNKDQ